MIKVYHHKMLTTEERERLNRASTWDCEPRFRRYTAISSGTAEPSTILTALLNNEYKLVATVDRSSKDDAFSLTNHIEDDWRYNTGVIAEAGEHRSTSVGDIMEDTDTNEIFVIACVGFQRLTLLSEPKRKS